MSSPPKQPPKQRNLAAKALRSPLFRPKIVPKPAGDKPRKRIIQNPVDDGLDE